LFSSISLVVVKLNEFAVGDLAIYYEIGSVPSATYPHTAFLGGKVIRTRKLCGVVSQGLLGPLSWLPEGYGTPEIDQDVTEVLGVMKWCDAFEMSLYSTPKDDSRASWPPMIPKTDEERIQNVRGVVEMFSVAKEVLLTQKYDGTSCTFVVIAG
jgi:hypothetical protein